MGAGFLNGLRKRKKSRIPGYKKMEAFRSPAPPKPDIFPIYKKEKARAEGAKGLGRNGVFYRELKAFVPAKTMMPGLQKAAAFRFRKAAVQVVDKLTNCDKSCKTRRQTPQMKEHTSCM